MYGKWIELNFGEGFQIQVYVCCVPNDSILELKERAKKILLKKLLQ